jgi:hypothetical protein
MAAPGDSTAQTPQVKIAPTARRSDGLEDARTNQQVIMEVLAAHEGKPESTVREALLVGLLRRGLPRPVDSWLDEVAAELAAGRAYVVAPDLDVSEFGRDAANPLRVCSPDR